MSHFLFCLHSPFSFFLFLAFFPPFPSLSTFILYNRLLAVFTSTRLPVSLASSARDNCIDTRRPRQADIKQTLSPTQLQPRIPRQQTKKCSSYSYKTEGHFNDHTYTPQIVLIITDSNCHIEEEMYMTIIIREVEHRQSRRQSKREYLFPRWRPWSRCARKVFSSVPWHDGQQACDLWPAGVCQRRPLERVFGETESANSCLLLELCHRSVCGFRWPVHPR